MQQHPCGRPLAVVAGKVMSWDQFSRLYQPPVYRRLLLGMVLFCVLLSVWQLFLGGGRYVDRLVSGCVAVVLLGLYVLGAWLFQRISDRRLCRRYAVYHRQRNEECVIELYEDRVVQLTAQAAITIYYKDAERWRETPAWMALMDKHSRAITWRADCLTAYDLAVIRQIVLSRLHCRIDPSYCQAQLRKPLPLPCFDQHYRVEATATAKGNRYYYWQYFWGAQAVFVPAAAALGALLALRNAAAWDLQGFLYDVLLTGGITEGLYFILLAVCLWIRWLCTERRVGVSATNTGLLLEQAGLRRLYDWEMLAWSQGRGKLTVYTQAGRGREILCRIPADQESQALQIAVRRQAAPAAKH